MANKDINWLLKQDINSAVLYDGSVYFCLKTPVNACVSVVYAADIKTKSVRSVNPIEYRFGQNGKPSIYESGKKILVAQASKLFGNNG